MSSRLCLLPLALLILACAPLCAAADEPAAEGASPTAAPKLDPLVQPATPLSIVKTQDLVFGRIIPNAGGTVTIRPQSGRTRTTGTLVSLPTPRTRQAQFSVTGEKHGVYGILFPDSVSLTRQGGVETMAIGDFQMHPRKIVGFLGGEGRQKFKVGARLTVGPHQAGGIYEGWFNVVVVYE